MELWMVLAVTMFVILVGMFVIIKPKNHKHRRMTDFCNSDLSIHREACKQYRSITARSKYRRREDINRYLLI